MYNKRNLQGFLIIFSLILANCSGDAQIGLKEIPIDHADDTTPESWNISSTLEKDPLSRWQNITLLFTDENNNPIPDANIQVIQKDIDFIYSTSAPAVSAFGKVENDQWIPYPDRMEQIGKYNALGFNNVEYYPWWMWLFVEPEDNQWDFMGATNAPQDATVIDDGQFTDRDSYFNDFPQYRFDTFWVGPQFNCSFFVPSWIDYENMDEFKKQFAEYITEAFRLHPDGHFDLYELTLEINDTPAWDKGAWDINDKEWQQAIEFIKWEAELIRSLDPHAKISIDFDPIVYFDDIPASHMTNWIVKIMEAGIAFDVIGLEIHPASFTNNPNNAEELEAFLDSLDIYGKEYYIWEYGVRSEGTPPIPEVPTDWQAPVEEYSEEFQKELYIDTFKVFIENPAVIGVRYLVYKDPALVSDSEYETWRKTGMGILREDRTLKPSYDALRDYWQSLLIDDSFTTDENGEINITAISGLFEVTYDGINQLLTISNK